MGIVAGLLDEIMGTLFPVTFTWVAINAPRVLGLNFSQMQIPSGSIKGKAASKETQPQTARFLKLIRREADEDIVYIRSELHYVRAVTLKGETLVLYNLKDAIVELEQNCEGIQTHRSYWVSGRHIKKLQNNNGKKYVIAGAGHKIPISRRRVKAVKDFMKI
jgi:DNA-binding LytR/AlgR family response regulator